MKNTIHNENCLTGLANLPDGSVNCCVTSPPYFGLRDYGTPDQLGLEETPEKFVENMVAVFREVKRVLKDDGTLWLNIGDSYAGSWGNYGGQNRGNGKQRKINAGSQCDQKAYEGKDKWLPPTANVPGVKPKDLIGIPWMLAFALRADGWYLRQDIIWHKPNPMPESVTDRCTKAHEYIFLLSKSQRYYYDHEAIKSDAAPESIERNGRAVSDNHKNINGAPGQPPHSLAAPRPNRKQYNSAQGGGGTSFIGHSGNYKADGTLIGDGKANKRSVWTVTTKPFSEAHFATFPEDLIVDCIKAGCPEGGMVLDPFMGAGTTALVARKLNRNYIGFELNADYIKIADKRLDKELGMFRDAV
jgi:DNA modification methylase